MKRVRHNVLGFQRASEVAKYVNAHPDLYANQPLVDIATAASKVLGYEVTAYNLVSLRPGIDFPIGQQRPVKVKPPALEDVVAAICEVHVRISEAAARAPHPVLVEFLNARRQPVLPGVGKGEA